jgi:hypothetical protein
VVQVDTRGRAASLKFARVLWFQAELNVRLRARYAASNSCWSGQLEADGCDRGIGKLRVVQRDAAAENTFPRDLTSLEDLGQAGA